VSGGWTAGAAGGVFGRKLAERARSSGEDSDCVEAIMYACGLCG
jgi:hypothetical protein